MKTNYIKSLIIFAFGSVFAVGADGLADSTKKTTHQEDLPPDSADVGQISAEADLSRPRIVEVEDTNCQAANAVSIDSAQYGVVYYQLWQRMLPNSFTLYDTTIQFSPVAISRFDASAITYFATIYNKANKRDSLDLRNLPFSTDSSLARSYYIPRVDMEAIFCRYPNAQGIRAHMALTPLNFTHLNSVSSHMYLAPALNPHLDSIDGVNEVYDLTLPCPSTCGKSSIFDK